MSRYPTDMLLRGVEDSRVREAFARVDRARFVPASLQGQAWSDRPLPIEDDATISQPSLVAKMTEWLLPGPEDRVLEIGTGSGYQTAILAELAGEVATVEYSEQLSRGAQERLDSLGYGNIHFRIGDGAQGWPLHAPYDQIIATVAFPGRPTELLDQLNHERGTAIVPVGPRDQSQHIIRYTYKEHVLEEEVLIPVRFLSLR